MATNVSESAIQDGPAPAARPAPRKSSLGRRLILLIVLFTVGAGGYFGWRAWHLGALESNCRRALEAKKWDELADFGRRLSWWQPGRAAPWMFRAQAAHEKGDLSDAAFYLNQLPDRDPKTPEALVERAALLFGPLNQPLEAEVSLRRALRLNPTIVEAHRRLIFFYAFTLQRKKMVDQIQSSIEWDCDLPETYLYLISQDWLSFGNAYEMNTKWMQSDKESELFLVARVIYRVTSFGLEQQPGELAAPDDDKSGIPYHERALADYFQRFPSNLELLAYYLKQASNDGDVERVAKLLATAPPESADDGRFWRYKGWLHDARGESSEAETAFRNAIRINAYDFVARHQLASVLRKAGKGAEVEQLERLYEEGKALRQTILELPDVQKAPRSVLWKVVEHATHCGQSEIAQKLARRLTLIERALGR